MSLEQVIQEARRILNVDLIPARLGDGNGNVYDLNNIGNYYLRKLEANGGLSQPFSLPVNPLASIPPKDGLSVSIGYDLRGIQCIWQADVIGMQASNVNPLILNPLDTAVYGKVSQSSIATLYCQRHGDTATYPFTVVVFPAPLVIDGVAKFFAGGAIDLSSFVPSTGLHCYATVFVKDDMTLEAFASTPTNLNDPLTVDVDIQECITQSAATSVIVWAWELRDTDTALSPDPARNVDMRQLNNTAVTGTGGGIVDAVVAGAGIAVDATDPANPVVSNDGVITIVAGTNITVDNTDPQNPVISSSSGGGTVDSVVGGTGIDVDATDPANPVVSIDLVPAANGGLGVDASAFAGLLKMAAGVASVAVANTDYTNPAGLTAALNLLSYKGWVRLVSAAALPACTYNNGTSGLGATLTANAVGAVFVDGQNPNVNDRLLIKDQATQLQNGIYIVTVKGDAGTAFVFTRATDADSSAEISNALVFAGGSGSTNAYTIWQSGNTATLGTDVVTYTRMTPLAGTGLSQSGNTLSIDSTVVTLTGSQTLTNKILTSPVVTGGSINNTPIGASTPSTGDFTDISVAGLAEFGASDFEMATGTAALQTSQGFMQWQSTRKELLLYDGVRERSLAPVGFQAYALQDGIGLSQPYASSSNIAAVSGTYLLPITLSASMLLYSVSVINKDASGQRTWGWDLYVDRQGNNNTIDRVATSNANDTFTAAANSVRSIVASGAHVYLPPGAYWLAIQNRHATNTFAIGGDALTLPQITLNNTKFKTTGGTNGATLDIVTSWSVTSSVYGVRLNGGGAGVSTIILI